MHGHHLQEMETESEYVEEEEENEEPEMTENMFTTTYDAGGPSKKNY